jgi:hypothetical protein
MGVVGHVTAAFPPVERDSVGGHLGWWERIRKISLTPGFDTRTVQLIASRYTDYALPAHLNLLVRTLTILFKSVKLCRTYLCEI